TARHWSRRCRRRPIWRRMAMRYCCRRPAPASTCSTIMHTGRRYLSTQSVTSRCRVARSPYETRHAIANAVLAVLVGAGATAAEQSGTALQDDGVRPAVGLGHAAADAAGDGNGVFGVDFLAGFAEIRELQERALPDPPGHIHRRLTAGRLADIPGSDRDLAALGALSVCRHADTAGTGVGARHRQ